MKIYELVINPEENNDAEVSYIALVDAPAIKKDFLAFNENFVEPGEKETEDEFISRCIRYVVNEGKDQEQAAAICYSKWENRFEQFQDSYDDYPEAAKKAAQTALRYADENGWGSCGTPVGKARANQLAKGEAISRETIGRMAAFDRHRENSDKPLGDGCGRLMWLAWGGDAGIEWAQRKLKQIDKEKMSAFAGQKVSFDYDDTLSTDRGKTAAKREIEAGNTVYIISARNSKDEMLGTASDLGIPDSRVYATGSNEAKIAKVKELGIDKHYDNNVDVIAALGSVGHKFVRLSFAIQNEDERIITGPLMIPEQLIYRNNKRFGEHYVKFSADTIRQISIKFAKKGYQKNVNLKHDAEMQVKNTTMFESFISDSKRGIKPMEAFADLPDGTWFGSFFVEDPKVWELIKKGEVKGFSVEGMFDYEVPESEEDKYSRLVIEELANIFKHF